jgi:hypothetical protein
VTKPSKTLETSGTSLREDRLPQRTTSWTDWSIVALALEETHELYAVVWWLDKQGVRRVMFRTWAIFYRTRPSHIDVMRIVHGGMRIGPLFRR